MFRIFRLLTITCILICLSVSLGFGQSVDLAKDYYQHNLNEKAKEALILLLHTPTASTASKAKSLYLLGQISFEEGHFNAAIADWNSLIKDYPQSSEAKEIGDRLAQLKEVTIRISDANITSTIARSYISNGDFWCKAERKFVIDSSWLPEVELSVSWYDRVLQEFPNSDAAELAYERKLFALLGWEDNGRDGKAHGVRADFGKYMPQVLETFSNFEKQFPKSSYLQAFRFQVAQAYWENHDWTNTRLWLRTVIDDGNGQETFYTETAKARLQKVEY